MTLRWLLDNAPRAGVTTLIVIACALAAPGTVAVGGSQERPSAVAEILAQIEAHRRELEQVRERRSELAAEIEEMRARVEALEAEVADGTDRIRRLEGAVEATTEP